MAVLVNETGWTMARIDDPDRPCSEEGHCPHDRPQGDLVCCWCGDLFHAKPDHGRMHRPVSPPLLIWDLGGGVTVHIQFTAQPTIDQVNMLRRHVDLLVEATPKRKLRESPPRNDPKDDVLP